MECWDAVAKCMRVCCMCAVMEFWMSMKEEELPQNGSWAVRGGHVESVDLMEVNRGQYL